MKKIFRSRYFWSIKRANENVVDDDDDDMKCDMDDMIINKYMTTTIKHNTTECCECWKNCIFWLTICGVISITFFF
ncbi:hypothetical protein DERF_001388 [Dermatophagoides farinae]|uniref:Uncharacterized protein n=1 Tax=Dermatophagoides farinae TaxID=6954 RepID=A0A922IAS0_DERFA|nr:hypothetical protein DERF_001388 [Dermatophagoides farinae]